MKARTGVAASAVSTSIEKSICMRPRPQPARSRVATTAADCGSRAAADTSRYQTASGGKKGDVEAEALGTGAGDPPGAEPSPDDEPQASRASRDTADGCFVIVPTSPRRLESQFKT